MPHVRIVTDSTAHFEDPDFPRRHNVTVAPLTIHFGRQSFRDGIDITTEQFFARLGESDSLPVAAAPTPEQFAAVYRDVARPGDAVVSIHVSGKLGGVCRNAVAAGEAFRGRCDMHVVDSATTSVGLGWLVEAAVKAAEAGESADEVVRIVRGLVPRMYVLFFVDSPTLLANSKRYGKAQAVLSKMLGIKPLLTIEEGDMVPLEKVRNRQQAVEKLIEFVSEYSELENLAVLQGAPEPTEDTRQLLAEMTQIFPARRVPVLEYGPSLASFIGRGGMGIFVFEGRGYDD
ncbi:MAG: DegV family protein [Chloroflexi bacterium]|nr:DegV family protein [Chloroflexota bacterium]